MSQENLRAKRETLLVAILLVLGSLVIIYPFLDAIVLAIAASYLLAFAHNKLSYYIKSDLLSTTIITSGLISFISLGLYLFIENIYEIIQRFNMFVMSIEDLVLSVLEPLNLPDAFTTGVSNFFQQTSDFTSDMLIGVLASMPSFLIQVAIFAVTSIYLYKDRARIYGHLKYMIEGLPETERKIIKSLMNSLDEIFRGVFMTQIIVAGMMGVAAAIGLYVISLITSPIPMIGLWSILIAVFAIFPIIAAFMIYAPLGLYYIVSLEPLKGSLIIIYGIVVLQILPEVLFRPWVGSKRLDEHPLIIFTGFIAGPLVLGLKGIILGPLILILTKEFILDYTDLVSSHD